MGYFLATLSMATKLACAVNFALDGDATAAIVFTILSPSMFMIARDSRVAR